jgi:signal transduction histidine kinase
LSDQGVILAHPMNAKLIGKDMTEVKDSDGKSFTKYFIATVNESGKGWVDYNWTKPISKKIEAKSSYVAKAGDIFVGCGIYK